jgi:superoxide dismutase
MLERKYVKKNTGTLAEPQLAPSSRQRTCPHVPENHRVCDNNNMVIISHPPYWPDLAPCDFTLFPQTENETEGTTF